MKFDMWQTKGDCKCCCEKPPCWYILGVRLSVLRLTSSRFQVRLLRARGSRLSGARGRSSTGLPLISGALLVEITGGIFLKLRLSSNTRSTNWAKTGREREIKFKTLKKSVSSVIPALFMELNKELNKDLWQMKELGTLSDRAKQL